MEEMSLLVIGAVCLVGSVVGGSFKIFNIIEIPMLNSKLRQIMLGVLGLALMSPESYSKIKNLQNNHRCDQYAEAAIDQFNQGKAISCPIKGERWHNDFAKHQGWCLTQSDSSAQSEIKVRVNELDICQSKRGKGKKTLL